MFTKAESTRYICIDTRDSFVNMCNRSNKYQLILIQHLLCIAQKEPYLSRSFLWSLMFSTYYSQELRYLEEYVLAGKKTAVYSIRSCGKKSFRSTSSASTERYSFAVIVLKNLRQQFSNISPNRLNKAHDYKHGD